MIAPKLYPFHSLLWAYDILFAPSSSGMLLGHKTRPGHCNMQHWWFIVIGFVCVFIEVFLIALYFRVTYCPPTFRAGIPLIQVPYVCECPVEGLGNMRHLYEWGTSSEGEGAAAIIICHVECITLSFLTFFQFGENTQWIMDGFALGRVCARCVDIDHFCTKAPQV